MSGQGRTNQGGRGFHHGGGGRLGQGSRKQHNNNNKTQSSKVKEPEMKFVLHCAGKQQAVTYDAVKDHIVSQIQKTLRHGNDAAINLREMSCTTNPFGMEPTRCMEVVDTTRMHDQAQTLELQLKQEGCNLKHQEDSRQ